MKKILYLVIGVVGVLATQSGFLSCDATLPIDWRAIITGAWDLAKFVNGKTELPPPSLHSILSQLHVVQAKLTEVSGAIRQLGLQIRTDVMVRDYDGYTTKLTLLTGKAQDYVRHPENHTLEALRDYCNSPDTDPEAILQWFYKSVVTQSPDILSTMIEGIPEAEVENLKDAFRSHVTQVALLRSACLSVADHKPSQSFLAQTKNKTLTTVRVISARIDGHKPLTLVCTSHQTAWQKLAYYNYVEYLADVEPVACPSGELLNSVLLVFEVTDGYSYSQIKARYVYRCCSSLARTVRACADKATGWQAGGWVHYLARHEVSCRDQLNAGLSKMALQRQQSGMIQYAYSCCPAKSTTRCEPRSTSWTRIGSMVHSIGINTRYRSMGMYGIGSESTYQLQLDCNDQLPYLSSFRMELNDEGQSRYNYVCCGL